MSYHTTQGNSIWEQFNEKEFACSGTPNFIVFTSVLRPKVAIEEKTSEEIIMWGRKTILHVVLKSQQVIGCGSWRATLAHAEITEITAALTVKCSWGCLLVWRQAPILAQTFRWGPVYSSGLQLFMTGVVYKCISPHIYTLL